jgi:hypothetical protein
VSNVGAVATESHLAAELYFYSIENGAAGMTSEVVWLNAAWQQKYRSAELSSPSHLSAGQHSARSHYSDSWHGS